VSEGEHKPARWRCFVTVTLKVNDDLDILKMYLTLKMKRLAQGTQNFGELELKKKSEIRCRDLDFGPMTLKLNCDLNILKR